METAVDVGRDTHLIQKPVKQYGDIFIFDFKKKFIPGMLNIQVDRTDCCISSVELEDYRKDPTVKGYVAVKLLQPVGYILFNSHKLIDIAVKAEFREKGVGTLLLNRLKNKISCIDCEVHETNTLMHNFLIKHKFKGVGVKVDFFEDLDEKEDAYCFSYVRS